MTKQDILILLLIFLLGGVTGGWIAYAVKQCPNCPELIPHDIKTTIDTSGTGDLHKLTDTLTGK